MKTLMHKTTVLTAATLALASAASAADVTVRPKATDEALINPDMGWVFYKYSNRLWAYGINTPGRKFPDTFAPLKPGDYTLAVSVGSWQGTPEIALPLDGQIGATRRYKVGRIRVR